MDGPSRRIPLVAIVGPTAAGKTALALGAALEAGAEIVSADSRQVFRGMNVGTAKPTEVERASVPHHMLDLVDPDEHFDAGEFRRLAEAVIRERWEAGVACILAGGSGLYVRALLHGLAHLPPPEPGLRQRLLEEACRFGPAPLRAKLEAIDPAAAARIHPNDAYRTTRALEIAATTGSPASTAWAGHGFREEPYDVLAIGLDLPDEDLRGRIRDRAAAMWEGGLLGETARLLERGLPRSLPSLKSVGYAEAASFLAGETTETKAIEAIVRRTWRYARRQRTWFRADPAVEWHDPGREGAAIAERIARFLTSRGVARSGPACRVHEHAPRHG